MKPLLAKEIRLLLPAYATALLLAVVPVWLLPKDPWYKTHAAIALYPFGFGAAMLALSAFGREFGLKTFPLLLAQPLERARIWWTKIAVLAGALATIFGVWCLTWSTCFEGSVWRETLMIGGMASLLAFAGGLWTTLLLRQMTAALWFTILIPAEILMVIVVIGMERGTEVMVLGALGLYSVVGFLFAWWQFLRVQEAAWTGGVISLPGWRAAEAASQPSIRARRPLAALCWKELQLHQVGLVGMGWLFLLHLGVVALRKAGHDAFGDTMRTALEVYGGIWLIVPLLAGSASVADERKLGTLEGHLCLPISSRVQFATKLLFVLVLGGLLSATLFWTAEGIAGAIGAGSDIGGLRVPSSGRALALLSLIFLALSLIAFYASTLARNIVQALAAAVVTTIVVWMLGTIASSSLRVFGISLWHGPLVHYIGWPTLVAAFVWLAYRNFRSVAESWRLWLRNTLGLTTALVFIVAFTTAVYHRAWELVTPLEPRHGPARLAGANPTTLHSSGHTALTVLMPNGGLWVDGIAYDPGRLVFAFGEHTGFRAGGKWASLSGNRIVAGSNWVDAVSSFCETVAIRSDGTLWVSEKRRQRWLYWEKGNPPAEEPAGLVRFGAETNWQSAVLDYWGDSTSMTLLKQDGTLWSWYMRPSSFSPNEMGRLGLRSFEPRRRGTDSDWAKIMSAGGSVYAWKSDGRAWALHPMVIRPNNGVIVLDADERLESFDNIKWRSLTRCWPLEAGVREDGTLWAWRLIQPPGANSGGGLLARTVQIGKDADWAAVAGHFQRLAALKVDGSFWEWDFPFGPEGEVLVAAKSPVRLGTHDDWVAVGSTMYGIVSLAADGSLWYWWRRVGPYYYDEISSQPMLAAPRKPSKIENILGEQE